MADPHPIIYLSAGEVVAFNIEILRRAGQPVVQVRDLGLLESAVQRPQNAAFYEHADTLTQATLYMVGIAINHPFVDGNKRAGFIAGITFLRVNDSLTVGPGLNDLQLGQWLEQVVSHNMSFEGFVERLRAHLSPP